MNPVQIKEYTEVYTYEKGKSLFQNNHVQELSVSEEEGFIDIEATVLGSTARHLYEVSLSIDEAEEWLENSYCNCPAFYSYDGICKHCVAVLLEYDRRRRLQNLPGGVQKGIKRITPKQMQFLLQSRETRRMLPYLQKEALGQVRLEPHLTISGGQAFVEFKIGITQMYVLKDTQEFIERLKNCETYSYGKKLSFTHIRENFTGQSRKYLDFISSWVEKTEAQMRYYYRYSSYDFRMLSLNAVEVEQFLDITGDTEFHAYIEGCKGDVWRVSEEEMQRKLTIRGQEDGIEVELNKEVSFRCVSCYIYFVSGNVYRVPVSKVAPIEDILEYMALYGNKVFIENKDIPSFCRTLLPDLKKLYQCRCHDFDEKEYEATPVTLRLYLDADGKNMISFRGMAVYDTKEYNIYSRTDLHQRNLAEEGLLKQKIEQYTNAYDEKREVMVLEDDALLYELLTHGIEELKAMFEVYVSDAIKRLRIVNSPKVTAGVSLSGDLLQLELTSGEMEREQLVELLSKYQKKRKFYRLKNGDLVHVADEGLERLVELKDNLLLTAKQLEQETITIPKYRALYVEEQLKDSEVEFQREEAFRKLIEEMSFNGEDYVPPEALAAILRGYQKEGFAWLKCLKKNGFGGILADDMGLGKTLQVIAFLMSEYQEVIGEKKLRTIIITPASLVYNWNYELERFAPMLTVCTIVGNMEERKKLLKESQADIFITSYDLLKRDIDEYEKINFGIEVIDEAQYIKNHGTQAAKAVKQLQSGFRLALTGTPIENRLSELWSIFDYLMPGFLYSAQRFRDEFEKKIIKEQDKHAMERIQKIISPFVLRRLKKDVLKDLPDKTEENVYIPMEGEQQKLYDAHVKRMQMMLEDKTEEEFNNSKIQILAELTKLRQLCCDPSILYAGYQGGAAKVEACIGLIQNAVANNHKVLLFSQFTSMLEVIQQRLIQEKITYYTLTGATSKEKRKQMVDKFQTGAADVFCISLKAGGTGLNLTEADIVIHFDPWWNVAAQNQATDRAHRIGQKHSVNVYRLIAKGTVEENIVRLQERKRDLADQVLGGSGIGSASMTREEMMEILSIW